MNDVFFRNGPINQLSSYPVWAQDMVESCANTRYSVVEHELFLQMRDATLDSSTLRNFLIGVWPVIEQFPQFMAMSLLKIRYGRNVGQDMARKYLIRNIRVEQNHADHWVEWSKASGVTLNDLLHASAPLETHALAHWCWHSCERDSLPASIAATNYAIEGAAGDWACLVCSQEDYANTFDPETRKKAMKWLKLHAEYDDIHPWEALEIICTLMGNNPTTSGISLIRSRIQKSYEYMRLTLDYCFEQVGKPSAVPAPIQLSNYRERIRASGA
jgi:pyrroloquinoline quinone (PQQ) biosynthesis protein C